MNRSLLIAALLSLLGLSACDKATGNQNNDRNKHEGDKPGAGTAVMVMPPATLLLAKPIYSLTISQRST